MKFKPLIFLLQIVVGDLVFFALLTICLPFSIFFPYYLLLFSIFSLYSSTQLLFFFLLIQHGLIYGGIMEKKFSYLMKKKGVMAIIFHEVALFKQQAS